MLSYDARMFVEDFDLVESPYINYLTNNTDLFEAIHVAHSPKVPTWSSSSSSVNRAYQSDNLIDYSSVYNDLIVKNYSYIVMSGEFDARDGAISQFVWMKELLDVSAGFWNQARQVYYYQVDGKQYVGG